MFFGLSTTRLSSLGGGGHTKRPHDVYVEYLSSIVDNDVLFRNDGNGTPVAMETSAFVDTRTKDLEVTAMFFSVEFGILTDLTIHFTADGGRVEGYATVEHFKALEGSIFTKYLILQILNICSMFL